MNRLVILPRHLLTISRHAAMSYPEECCGVLIGRSSADGTFVERVLSVGNERQDSRHNRFLINPETVLAAHKEARALGLDIVGYYHSHPDHPAQPSEFDREHAWPGLSYLIVSVQGGKVAEARSWRLSDDRDRYEEEKVEQGAGLPPSFSSPFGMHKEAV
ncbi:MAG TPA: M67 family metallopeptidase [Thermoanaerobaculia bacterium]|nr:M67 family metallopeptidase [Thermoanaerobaculia bacterium]